MFLIDMFLIKKRRVLSRIALFSSSAVVRYCFNKIPRPINLRNENTKVNKIDLCHKSKLLRCYLSILVDRGGST